jgi:hypothetical protein
LRHACPADSDDGTITRFGWKAQNKSLLMFSGEAYNVEMGVSNDLFPQKRDETPGCQTTNTPNDSITAKRLLLAGRRLLRHAARSARAPSPLASAAHKVLAFLLRRDMIKMPPLA